MTCGFESSPTQILLLRGLNRWSKTGVVFAPWVPRLSWSAVVLVIILLITAVSMLERRQRRALRGEAEPSVPFESSLERFRHPRDETPDDQTRREIPDPPPTPQTWWAKWAEQRARRRRELYGYTELGDSLGFGKDTDPW